MSKPLHEAEDAAAVWDARLRGARATARDHLEFHAWLEQAPEHQVAHDRLQAALAVLRDNADQPEMSALRDETRNAIHFGRRRRIALAFMGGIAALLLITLGLGRYTDRGQELVTLLEGGTVYSTAADEHTRVTLADGSVVTLDSGTRLLVRLQTAQRNITLLAGRALFQVAKDRHRPFMVRARDRTITALGTLFDVRLDQRGLRVTLAEGSVAVTPVRQHGGPPEILKPSQQFVETDGDTDSPDIRNVDTYKVLSWADGQVYFENETLAAAAEQMNQYSRHVKIVVDPSVGGLRINGMFRTSNQLGFAEALEAILPVEALRNNDGSILITGRQDRIVGQQEESEAK